MLKKEKKRFKKLSGKSERQPFMQELIARLQRQGEKRLQRWVRVYTRKTEKKGVPNPLDKLKLPEP